VPELLHYPERSSSEEYVGRILQLLPPTPYSSGALEKQCPIERQIMNHGKPTAVADDVREVAVAEMLKPYPYATDRTCSDASGDDRVAVSE